MRLRPLGARLKNNKRVRDARRHRVGRQVGGAGFRKNQLDLVQLGHGALDLKLHPGGLLDAGAGNAHRVHGNIALVKLRDEHLP